MPVRVTASVSAPVHATATAGSSRVVWTDRFTDFFHAGFGRPVAGSGVRVTATVESA